MRARHSAFCLLFASLAWSTHAQALRLDQQLGGQLPQVSAAMADDTSLGTTAIDPGDAAAAARVAVTRYIRSVLGKPYRLGATGKGGFDCSGLVLRAYQAAGLEVPRVSLAQLKAGEPVSLSQLQAGDLLFYRFKAGEPDDLHVVVYVGGGRAIHASVSHHRVREVDITGTVWSRRLVAARTLL